MGTSPPATAATARMVSRRASTLPATMVAVMAAPVVAQRFDAPGATWSPDDLAARLGAFFDGREGGFSAGPALRTLSHAELS